MSVGLGKVSAGLRKVSGSFRKDTEILWKVSWSGEGVLLIAELQISPSPAID